MTKNTARAFEALRNDSPQSPEEIVKTMEVVQKLSHIANEQIMIITNAREAIAKAEATLEGCRKEFTGVEGKLMKIIAPIYQPAVLARG